jgi:hypothetical protein
VTMIVENAQRIRMCRYLSFLCDLLSPEGA